MCEPTTILAVTAAVKGVADGYAAKQEGKFKLGVARYNARVTENEAQAVKAAGLEKENVMRQQTAQLVARQRAAAAANGIDIESGSALQLQQDAKLIGEVDALRIRSNIKQKFDAMNTQADLTLAEGEQAYKAGKNALTSSLLVAGVTAGAGVASKWYKPDSLKTQLGAAQPMEWIA